MFKSITKLLISFVFIMCGDRFSKETMAMYLLAHNTNSMVAALNLRQMTKQSIAIFNKAISENKKRAEQIRQNNPTAINLDDFDCITQGLGSKSNRQLDEIYSEQTEVKSFEFFKDYFELIRVSKISFIAFGLNILDFLKGIGPWYFEKYPNFFNIEIGKLRAMAYVSKDEFLTDQITRFQTELTKMQESTNIEERNSKIEEMRTIIESMIASLE